MIQKIRQYILWKKAAVLLVFAAAFFVGRTAAALKTEFETAPAAAEGSWGLSFQEEGKPPVANATREELAKYHAWYSEDTQEKIIYLTFDCGYENGNTPAILAALKKHQEIIRVIIRTCHRFRIKLRLKRKSGSLRSCLHRQPGRRFRNTIVRRRENTVRII